MRLFEERVGINPSYIHGIEKGNVLPSMEKLELLASVFVDVAREQEAADPKENARRLFKARERAAVATAVEQLDLDERVSNFLTLFCDLDDARQADIIQPLNESIALFERLEGQERSAVNRLLPKLIEFLETGDEEERTKRAAFVGEAAERSIENWPTADVALTAEDAGAGVESPVPSPS